MAAPAAAATSRRSMGERWGLAATTALVTGGSKGIGHAIVEELAGLGARVHTCSRNAEELEACRRRWAEKNLRVTVSVRADREKLMDTVRQAFGGKLEVLVNNAGQSMVKAATECTGEDYARVMATNLESCFHLAQLAHPLLLVSGGRGGGGGGGGSVVHISSIAGFVGFPCLAVYSMTKGAMNQLTRSLAAEWAGDGIRVNCVAAGGINTDIAKDVETMDPEMVSSQAARVPMGRLGETAEVGFGGSLPLHAGGLLHHRPSHLSCGYACHESESVLHTSSVSVYKSYAYPK